MTNSNTAEILATPKPWLVCGISRSQWYKLQSQGRTPAPVANLGQKRPIWLIGELRAWLDAGAPNRDQWERLKAESPSPANGKHRPTSRRA